MYAVFAVELRRRREGQGRMAAARYGLATVAAAVVGAFAERVRERRRRVRARGGVGGGSRGRGGTQERRGTMVAHDLRQDLGLLARQIRRRPGFGAVVVLTLALGIGISTGVFTVVRGILLRPLPFPEPGELLYLTGGGASSLPNLQDLRGRLHSMEVMAGLFVAERKTLTGVGDATQLRTSVVTPEFFRMTGLEPDLGRWLGPEDDGTHRAVLSHRTWRARFSADPGIVGRSITLDEEPVEVVGVAPATMVAPFDVDAWLAEPWSPGQGPKGSRGWRAVEVYGRLAPGRTVEEARGELASAWRGLRDAYPGVNGRGDVGLTTVKAQVTGSEEAPLEILFLASGLFLLLACANVAGIFLSRLDSRLHEFAVRSALGAGRWRLLRQAWTEALAVSAAGGMAGVALAALAVGWALDRFGSVLSAPAAVTLDGAVLGFALAVTLLTAAIVGIATVATWNPDEPADALRRTAAGVVNRSGPLRRTLVVGEVAMAFVIVTGLGLLVRSFLRVSRVDTGVRVEGLVAGNLGTFPASRYPDDETRRVLETQLGERLAAVPGVEGVALSSHLPLGGCCSNRAFHRGDDPERESRFVEVRWVSPSYFAVLGIPLVDGHGLDDVGPDDPPATVIDQVLAEQLFDSASPVGGTVTDGPDTLRVVGVAGRVREYSPARPAPPIVYLSARQFPMSGAYLVVRSRLALAPTVTAMREAVRGVDPLLPLENVRSVDDVLAGYTADQRATTLLMVVLGALAMVLGVVGIYGVMSHSVQGSLREIGVRLMLGASRQRVRRGILRGALVLVLPGIALGIAGAMAARGLIASLLYETSALDPLVYAAVVVVFVLAPVAAALGPARRAARVDPAEMLRG
jgi:putative ABC transport system permease protein